MLKTFLIWGDSTVQSPNYSHSYAQQIGSKKWQWQSLPSHRKLHLYWNHLCIIHCVCIWPHSPHSWKHPLWMSPKVKSHIYETANITSLDLRCTIFHHTVRKPPWLLTILVKSIANTNTKTLAKRIADTDTNTTVEKYCQYQYQYFLTILFRTTPHKRHQ